MTRSDSNQSQLDPQAESELVKRLANQANRIAVSPELLVGVGQRHRSILRRRRTVSRVALAGSVVGVVVLVFGLLQVGGLASDSDVLDPAAASDLPDDPVAEACRPTSPWIESADQLVIWLDVGVAPKMVEQIEAKLKASSEVAAFDYIDLQQTYWEFELYYADEPEILDLVEAEQLPTSFRVQLVEETQAIPVGLAWVDVDGVNEIEFGEQTCDPIPSD